MDWRVFVMFSMEVVGTSSSNFDMETFKLDELSIVVMVGDISTSKRHYERVKDYGAYSG
jgi:hypothetical protein